MLCQTVAVRVIRLGLFCHRGRSSNLIPSHGLIAGWSRAFHRSPSFQASKWSRDEKNLALQMYKDGAPDRAIHAKLPDRTLEAVRAKIRRLAPRGSSERTNRSSLTRTELERISHAKKIVRCHQSNTLSAVDSSQNHRKSVRGRPFRRLCTPLEMCALSETGIITKLRKRHCLEAMRVSVMMKSTDYSI